MKKLPNQIFEEKAESYYHAIIFLIFLLLGYEIQSEVSTSEGRIDSVVQTDTHVYILEFKVNESAESAIQQIREKKYYCCINLILVMNFKY
jgi:predicted type IV restriction endonuclease